MATRLLTCRITIGDNRFSEVNEVRIDSSWKEIGETAFISLPNLEGALERTINTGDRVTIELGYDGVLREEFRGYVKSISPKIPFNIECEDEVYNLKRSEVIKSWKSVSLIEVLKFIAPGVELSPSIPDITLSPFRISKATAFEALKKLKEEYLLAIYFRNGRLYAGLAYTEFTATTGGDGAFARYHFQRNVVADDLVFRKIEDVKLKVQAQSFIGNNEKITVEVGDMEGETRTLVFQGIQSEKALKKLAEEKLSTLKYEGYYGSLTGFGEPFIKHSGVVQIEDDKYPRRTGRYLVDRVETSFGTGGFKRKLDVGPKASAA